MQKGQLGFLKEYSEIVNDFHLSKEERFFKAVKQGLTFKQKRNRHVMPQLQPISYLQIPVLPLHLIDKNNDSSSDMNSNRSTGYSQSILKSYRGRATDSSNNPSYNINPRRDNPQRIIKSSRYQECFDAYFPREKKAIFSISNERNINKLFNENQNERKIISTTDEKDLRSKHQWESVAEMQSARSDTTFQTVTNNNKSFSMQEILPDRFFQSHIEYDKEQKMVQPKENDWIFVEDIQDLGRENQVSPQIIQKSEKFEVRRQSLNKLYQSEILSEKQKLTKNGESQFKKSLQIQKKQNKINLTQQYQATEVCERKLSSNKSQKLRERIDKVLNFSLVERMSNIVKEVRNPSVQKASSILKLPSIPNKQNFGTSEDFKKKQVHFHIYEEQETKGKEEKSDKISEKKEPR